MADTAKEEALAIDQELAAIHLDHGPRGRARRRARRQQPGGAGGPAGRLERRRLQHGTNLDIVDPGLGKAGTGVEIEHDLVDVGVGEVDVVLQLSPHELLLFGSQRGRAAQLQAMRAAGLFIVVAAQHDGQRLVQVLGIALLGQHQPAQKLQTRTIGLEPEADAQLIADGRLAGRVIVIDVAACLGMDADVFAVLAGTGRGVSHLVD